MKQLNLLLILPWLLLSFEAIAEQSLQPQTQGDVSFVSGGVGSDEQNALQAMRADYNLSLLFSAQGTGEYLSEVNVNIKNSAGETVLQTVSQGPKLFAKLKPGRYSITADIDGQAVHKTAKVRSGQMTSLSFTWVQ